jgi:hypothetical protein
MGSKLLRWRRTLRQQQNCGSFCRISQRMKFVRVLYSKLGTQEVALCWYKRGRAGGRRLSAHHGTSRDARPADVATDGGRGSGNPQVGPITFRDTATGTKTGSHLKRRPKLNIAYIASIVVTICTVCFDITKTLYSAYTVYLYVSYGSHNKQRLFPQTALTGWSLCGDVVCSLWGTNWIFKYLEKLQRLQKFNGAHFALCCFHLTT